LSNTTLYNTKHKSKNVKIILLLLCFLLLVVGLTTKNKTKKLLSLQKLYFEVFSNKVVDKRNILEEIK